MDEEKSAICDTEIESLLEKGALRIASESNGFISNLLIVPKKLKENSGLYLT